MYSVTKSVDVDFAHQIAGHPGACINLHGHTWKFEVTLAARELDAMGFVVDFKELKARVLQPVHTLLDHSLVLGKSSWEAGQQYLAELGRVIVVHPAEWTPTPMYYGKLGGAVSELAGGLKVVVFPFNPTSERLAKWLFDLAVEFVYDTTRDVVSARVYEALHPVQSVAEFCR